MNYLIKNIKNNYFNKHSLFFTLLALLLSGCNSGNYQSYQGGVGYSSIHQNDNIYTVTYTGTKTTKIEKVNDFALLRSAELAIEKGYNYFVITQATNNKGVLGSNGTGIAADDKTNYSASEGGGSFGASFSPLISNRPKAESKLVIYLFNEKPDTLSYEAKLIERALKQEYEMNIEQ